MALLVSGGGHHFCVTHCVHKSFGLGQLHAQIVQVDLLGLVLLPEHGVGQLEPAVVEGCSLLVEPGAGEGHDE